jgi:hypothetical protein
MQSPEILLVPLLIGLVEVAKQTGLPVRWVPVTTLALAVFLGYFIGIDWIQGLVFGLSACGLWSGVKATVGR